MRVVTPSPHPKPQHTEYFQKVSSIFLAEFRISLQAPTHSLDGNLLRFFWPKILFLTPFLIVVTCFQTQSPLKLIPMENFGRANCDGDSYFLHFTIIKRIQLLECSSSAHLPHHSDHFSSYCISHILYIFDIF